MGRWSVVKEKISSKWSEQYCNDRYSTVEKWLCIHATYASLFRFVDFPLANAWCAWLGFTFPWIRENNHCYAFEFYVLDITLLPIILITHVVQFYLFYSFCYIFIYSFFNPFPNPFAQVCKCSHFGNNHYTETPLLRNTLELFPEQFYTIGFQKRNR